MGRLEASERAGLKAWRNKRPIMTAVIVAARDLMLTAVSSMKEKEVFLRALLHMLVLHIVSSYD
jgi:hypothetical protein